MKKIKRSSNPSFIKNCNEGKIPKKIKLETRKILSDDTNDCCAYCNAGNILSTCPEIEHFFPKSHFPSKSCEWENLFLSCSQCNSHKLAKYFGKDEFGINGKLEAQPLKPDATNYEFEDNFTINILTGEINSKNIRAKTTINFFGLNHPDRNSARKKELERYKEFNFCANYAFFIEEFIKINKQI